jgi:hydroxyethylthiazole kinase-like uncharacterized protein yjeF
MWPVFTADEMRALDTRAISSLGIPGPRLMANAGRGAADVIAREWAPIKGKRVVVLCGKGNNGGDGFVVARLLKAKGARVRVFLLGSRADVKGDAAQALSRWRGKVEEVGSDGDLPMVSAALDEADLIVDGLLGTGLSGPAHGLVAHTIERLNESAARLGTPVIALDLPSGLGSDGGTIFGPSVRAGRIVVASIGVPDREVRRGIATFLLDEASVREFFPKRKPDAHKGTYGHLVVVAGSLGKSGAAALAGRAALRSGVGLCTVATAASQQPIVASFTMELMTEALVETAAQSISFKAKDRILELASQRDAVAVGPGLSLDPESQALARALVAEIDRPMVVDADALSALAGHLDLLDDAPGPRVLTPHPGEMARMLGTTIAEVEADRIETVREFCSRHHVHLVLKGARSVLGAPDGRVFINHTGNPGMATGGSGDVLTGMVGAFLARRFDPLAALQAGCVLHGLAGDLAAAGRGEEGLNASDIIEAIPGALNPAVR